MQGSKMEGNNRILTRNNTAVQSENILKVLAVKSVS